MLTFTVDAAQVLHVFARTRGTPPVWYYRQRAEAEPGVGKWTAWETVNLDIKSDNLLPVVWDQRLSSAMWPESQAGESAHQVSNSRTRPRTPCVARHLSR